MKRILIILALMIPLAASAQGFEPVPFDKKYHMGAGALAGVWGTFAGNSLELTPEQSALFGIASATVAGIGKELMDISEGIIFKQEHNFDPMDVAATVAGGIIGTGLSYLGLKIFKRSKPYYAAVNDKMTVGFKVQF